MQRCKGMVGTALELDPCACPSRSNPKKYYIIYETSLELKTGLHDNCLLNLRRRAVKMALDVAVFGSYTSLIHLDGGGGFLVLKPQALQYLISLVSVLNRGMTNSWDSFRGHKKGAAVVFAVCGVQAWAMVSLISPSFFHSDTGVGLRTWETTAPSLEPLTLAPPMTFPRVTATF